MVLCRLSGCQNVIRIDTCLSKVDCETTANQTNDCSSQVFWSYCCIVMVRHEKQKRVVDIWKLKQRINHMTSLPQTGDSCIAF